MSAENGEVFQPSGGELDSLDGQAGAEELGAELAELATQPAGPDPLLHGTFALYPDGAGGFVLVTETDAHGVNRKHIPSAMVKLAMKAINGGGLLAKVFR